MKGNQEACYNVARAFHQIGNFFFFFFFFNFKVYIYILI